MKHLRGILSCFLSVFLLMTPICASLSASAAAPENSNSNTLAVIDPTDADKALYELSYQSLKNRVQENGYAPTSLTGAYEGMYVRDAAAQVMAMTVNGDLEDAQKILDYIFTYHETAPADYALCILPSVEDFSAEKIAKPISSRIQSDTAYLLLHALVKWYNACTDTTKRDVFWQRHWTTVQTFANYFLQPKYYNEEKKLIRNPNFQHITSYINCYDLYTNVFASQALHELAELAKEKGETEIAATWNGYANAIKDGIHTNLARQYEGKMIYMELLYANPEGRSTGFSFVNLSPLAAEWFGTDRTIMINTYEKYLEDASKEYDGCLLLDSRHIYDSERWSDRLLGKQLGWEVLYCTQYTDSTRMRMLLDFAISHTEQGQPYAEAWRFDGKKDDYGNQEQTAWIIYCLATVMPQLRISNQTEVSSTPSVTQPSSAVSKPVTSNPATNLRYENHNQILFIFCILAGLLVVSIALLSVLRIREYRKSTHRKKLLTKQAVEEDPLDL